MRNLIGFFLIILGGVTAALFSNPISYAVMFIGLILFGMFFEQDIVFDYVIVNSNKALMRKRYYMNYLIFTIPLNLLTFEHLSAKILYKQEYFIHTLQSDENAEPVKLSRKKYIELRNEQRAIYSKETLDKEFIMSSYELKHIGYIRKKIRLIVVWVLAVLLLAGLVEPLGFILVLPYEVIFIWLIILWTPEYKDAKILHRAYIRAIKQNN